MKLLPSKLLSLFVLVSYLSFYTVSQSPVSTVKGCISSQTINNITNCYACDSKNNWMFLPPHRCICKTGYKELKLNNIYYCTLSCQEGIWTEEQQCDDGNSYNDDGCSSHCTKQDNFKCVNLYHQKSVCRYTPYVTSKVYSLSRSFGTSQLLIKFMFIPFHPIIRSNDWSQHVTVDSSKITFDSHYFEEDKILVLNYLINQSVESQTLTWTLSYDKDKFLSGKNIHKVEMSGMNAPLTFDTFYQHEKVVQVVSYSIGGLSIVIGIVAMVKAESKIAFELITTVLFVFYARVMSYHHNPAIIYALNGLRIAGGYNEYFHNQQRDYIEYRIKNRFFIKSELGLMSIATLSLQGIALIFKVIFQLKSFFNLITSKQIVTNNIAETKKQWKVFVFLTKAFHLYLLFQKKFSIPIMLISQYTILCAFNGFQNVGDRYESYFGPFATNLFLLFFFIVLIYYLTFGAAIVGNFFDKLTSADYSKKDKKPSISITTHQSTNQYTERYFLYIFITSIFIFFTMDFTIEQRNLNWVIQICFGLTIFYLISLIIFKPYKSSFHMFAIIFHEFFKLFFLVYLFLIEKQFLSQLHQLIGVYITLVFLMILLIISIIRIKISWIHDSNLHQTQQMRQAFKKQQNLPTKEVQKPKKKRIRNNSQNIYLYENIIKKQKQQQQKQQSLNNGFAIINKSKTQKSRKTTSHSKNQSSINEFQKEAERFTIFDGFYDKKKPNENQKQQEL